MSDSPLVWVQMTGEGLCVRSLSDDGLAGLGPID